MFGKVSSLLMCSAKVGNVGDTNEFIKPIPSPADATAFDKLIANADSKMDYETKNYNSEVSNKAK